MSSNCPPQLQLSIQPNTTSFKRSFEQFGFDLESPVVTDAGATAATSDGRNERNKRARSASSFDSETSSNLSSDTTASTSSSGSSALSEGGAIDTFAIPTSIEPPRLPTPEIQDVEMPDYPAGEPIEVEREGLRGGEQYRLSLGRFNDFDNEIAVLRQPPPTTTTSPPILPPLRHRLLQDAFFRRIESPGSPYSPTFFEESHPSTSNSDSPQLHTQNPADDAVESPGPSNPHFDLFRESQPLPSLSLSTSNTIPAADPPPTPGFRNRLDSALERLRSPSPLVPGLEDDQDRSDEEDGDEEDEEDDSEGPMAESEAEPETDELAENNAIQEHPPTLPPIRTVENFSTGRTILSALSTTQSAPPDPPTLPPIPTISSDVVTNATERAWHGRNELFAERFDDFLRINRLFTPTPENNPVVAPSPPQSPAADARETTAASTSPRPFSRSARSVLSSSRPRNITTNPSLGDHPLPSPILRDLRSWLEERQPSLSNDASFSYSSLHADDASSVSSISTAAATAGTERDASASLTTSASATQASSSTASESSTSHQDRLSRMLDRIRTGRVEDWAGHGIRREWLSPPPPTPSAPAPPVDHDTDNAHTVRDLLPWFTGDPAPASAFGAAVPSATPAASRPISTTPAPGNSVLGRSEDLALDSYWEPVFTNLPEATFASASSTQNGTSEQGSSMAASDDRPSDNAVTIASRPTSSSTHVEAGSSPGYLSHIMRHSGDAGRTINPADASNNGDRHTNDPAAGMWRPLEPSDLPLSLSFNSTSTSNSNTRPQPPLIHTPPNYFDRPPSPSFDPRSIPDTSYLYGTSFLNRSALETYGSGWASPPNPGTNPMAILAREEMRRTVMDRRASILRHHETLAMREMFDMTENAHQPSSLAPSSLRNWNGRSGEEDGPQTQSQSQSQSQAPVSQSTSIRTEATSSAVSTRNSETTSSIESRRTDPRLRHRLLRSSSSQMRLGSSNSLVTENASEVRRRADYAEIRRLPGERSSLFGLNMEDHLTDSSDGTGQSERPRRESSWENVLLQRAWGEGERRRRASVTSERLDSRMPARASSPSLSSIFTSAFTESAALPSLTTFVDGLTPTTRGAAAGNADERPRQSQPPTPTSGPPSSPILDIWGLMSAEGNSGGGTDSSQPPRHDAPSLPPPDLGSSFNAGHNSRSMSAPWVSTEDSAVDDPMGAPVASANIEPARIDNANERPNNRSQRNLGLRPLFLSSTMSPGERQLPDHEQQQNELHQIDERARRLQLERRLLEDRRRFTSAFRARHPLSSDPNSQRPSAPRNGPGASTVTSPASAPTTASSSASAMGISRPSLSQMRRPSMGDPVGLHALFDPSTFTPGPFRNTLQHIANEREGQSANEREGQSAARFESNTPRSSLRRPPPYIPPLSFDSENEHSVSSPRQADSIEARIRRRTELDPMVREGDEMNGPGARRAPRIMRELPFESHSPTRPIPQDDYEPYFSGPRNSSPIVTNEATSTHGPNGLRRLSDNWRHSTLNLERYLGEQTRMEASRVADSRYSFYPGPPVFSSVIESLRPDNPGTNALGPGHPIHRYHRERELGSRTEEEEDASPPGDSRARRRGRVLRAHQEAIMSFSRVSNANMGGAAGWRRGRALGDFMRDEDFDDSYENLLSLSMQIGDVKPRATPAEVLEKMEKAIYKDWATDGSDTRCPICLDDYAPTDPVQKLSNCSHWLHRECLTQWLQSATTCPVCRESVNIPPSSAFSASRLPRYPPRLNPFNMSLPRRRRESSPTAPNHPSSPSTQGSNTDGRDTSNRNGGQETNRPQESPSRNTFPAPWRYRPA